MTDIKLDDDLEFRISELEKMENLSPPLAGKDWRIFLITGVVLPILLLLWGAW